MSESSPSMTDAHSIEDIAVEFHRRDSQYYTVYYAKVGKDLVYQYWPAPGSGQLPPDFALKAEVPYKNNLRPTAVVEADYHDRTESMLLKLMRPDGGVEDNIEDMLYIRIREGTQIMGHTVVLLGTLFDELDALLEAEYAVEPEPVKPAAPVKALSKRARRMNR